jgi:hypothetical protein
VDIGKPAHALANQSFQKGPADEQAFEAAREARMFSPFKAEMRVSHRIDQRCPAIDRFFDQAGEEAFQSAEPTGKEAMRVPALWYPASVLAHSPEAVSLHKNNFPIVV